MNGGHKMTKETIESLEGARSKIGEYLGFTDDLKKFVKSIECHCDHRLQDGSDARTYDADGAYCVICKKYL